MKRKRVSVILAAVLVAAALLLPLHAAAVFTDVTDGSWYYDVVILMAEAGVVQGYEDGSFRPGGLVTSAEFVTQIARISRLEEADSAVSHWAAGHMAAALSAGWYDWDEIPPEVSAFDTPLPRQVAVKILMKALLPEATGSYGDWAPVIRDFDRLDGRYYEPVFAAYEQGILRGDGNGNLNPRDGITRAEVCALLARAGGYTEQAHPSVIITGGVSRHGWLGLDGTQLVSETGEPVVLRGMSTHGIQWYGRFAGAGTMLELAERGANLIRIAMYTEENGYLANPDRIKKQVIEAVDTAIDHDLYVIIDWHILSDGDPNTHLAESKAFFAEMAERYKDTPNVIYEVCNEPNGQDITWEASIRPYAMEVIPVIREHSPDALILVGTGTWSQDVHQVAANPLPDSLGSVMYTLHFYAGTHTWSLRDRAAAALAAGTPLFVSEWGLSDASGGGSVYPEEGQRWVDFMAQHGISWANWSLCDKNEASAALIPGANPGGGWQDNDLSPSGALVFGWLQQ